MRYICSLWPRALLHWKQRLKSGSRRGAAALAGLAGSLLLLAYWLVRQGGTQRWARQCAAALQSLLQMGGGGGAHLWGPLAVAVVFLVCFIAAL